MQQKCLYLVYYYRAITKYALANSGREKERGRIMIVIKRNGTEVDFNIEGVVSVPCDICLDDMEQPICADNRLIVKFGKENSEDDELVVVREDDGVLDISWFLYESIVLNIPIKHVHAPGKCNRDMMNALEAHSATRSDVESNSAVDPRWSELLKIKDKDLNI